MNGPLKCVLGLAGAESVVSVVVVVADDDVLVVVVFAYVVAVKYSDIAKKLLFWINPSVLEKELSPTAQFSHHDAVPPYWLPFCYSEWVLNEGTSS